MAAQKVSVPQDVTDTIRRLKASGETEGDVVRRAVDWLDAFTVLGQVAGADELRMNYGEFRKAGIACLQMRDAAWADEKTVATCRALFCDQTDADIKEAFKYFDISGDGSLDRKEIEQALPLMGENVSQERIDELFVLVDADGSGKVDVNEFGRLVRGMNPKDGVSEFPNVFAGFSVVQGAGGYAGGAAAEAAGNLFGGVTSTFGALGAAYQADLPGLGPIEMRKAGVIINKMKGAGYTDEMAHTVVRALFCEQSEEQMRAAFKCYDADGSGELELSEFRDALPLMGEDVPAEWVEDAFKKVDSDGTGRLDFGEFCALIKMMNQKPEGGAQGEGGQDGIAGQAMSWFKS